MRVFYTLILFLTFVFCLTVFGQNKPNAQLNGYVRLWTFNSDFLTGNIETDIGKLSPENKVLFYGRLGEAWWKNDFQKGRGWLDKAVKIIESPATVFADNSKKLQAIRSLLKIVSSKDEAISNRLLKRLTETTEELSENNKIDNSKAVVESAIIIADSNPQKALSLGTIAIFTENPTFSVILFWKLHNKNNSFSDKYFQAGLNRLQSYIENEFLFQIKLAGLPETINGSNNRPKPNELLRKRFLAQLADLLRLEAEQVLEKRIAQCNKFWFLGQNSIRLFAQILPSKLESMNFTRSICENSRIQSHKDQSEKNKSLKTIEDYLTAADEAEDQETKDNYRISAAGIAFRKKNYKQAIEILEVVSEDGRELGGGIWSKFYIESWIGLVTSLYKNDEITSIYSTVDKAPDSLKPLLYITLARESIKGKDSARGYEFLTESRNLFKKINFEPRDDYKLFFSSPVILASMPKMFADIGYENEAIESHQEAVKVLNEFIAKIPSDEQDKRVHKLPIIWRAYTNLPEDFFEKYFQNIQSSISEVEYLPLKVKLKLDVLKFSLFKLDKYKKELNKAKRKLIR